jgi:hypothetical protein
MNRIQLAAAIVCFGLASCSAFASDVQSNAAEPVVARLSRDELIARLSGAYKFKQIDLLDVLDTLYEAENSTEVFEGLTVAELIKQSDTDLAYCSQAALRRRVDVLEALLPNIEDTKEFGARYTLAMYCLVCVHEAASYCAQHIAEVVAGGHNTDQKWLAGLAAAIEHDGSELDLTDALIFALPTGVMRFVKTGSFLPTNDPTAGIGMSAGYLFADMAPSEELTREELVARLAETRLDDGHQDNHLVERVARALHAAKDKNSTEVHDKMTVAELVGQNHMDLAGCRQEALERRVTLFEALRPRRHYAFPKQGVRYALALYTLACVNAAAMYCVERHDDVLAAGINTNKYLKFLSSAVRHDGGTDFDPATSLQRYEDSTVSSFILNSHHFRR